MRHSKGSKNRQRGRSSPIASVRQLLSLSIPSAKPGDRQSAPSVGSLTTAETHSVTGESLGKTRTINVDGTSTFGNLTVMQSGSSATTVDTPDLNGADSMSGDSLGNSGAGNSDQTAPPEPAGNTNRSEPVAPTGLPNGDQSDARMDEIAKILGYTAMPKLDKYELVAEWVRIAEATFAVFGQNVHKPHGGRPEGGFSRAARELPVPGKTFGAKRKSIVRAVEIDAISDDAKAAARAAGLDDIQFALLAIASERSSEAQLTKIQEIVARKATRRRRKSSALAGNESASTLNQVEVLAIEVSEGQQALEEDLETVGAAASCTPTGGVGTAPTDDSIPAYLDRRPLGSEDQHAFDSVMAAWRDSAERAALLEATLLVRERFLAAVRAELAA
jgi:hypothetical protein